MARCICLAVPSPTNTVVLYYGSGIAYFGGLSISRRTITGNTAVHGGGIYNTGTLHLTNSTVRYNKPDDIYPAPP
jgi:hypothetical protein